MAKHDKRKVSHMSLFIIKLRLGSSRQICCMIDLEPLDTLKNLEDIDEWISIESIRMNFQSTVFTNSMISMEIWKQNQW